MSDSALLPATRDDPPIRPATGGGAGTLRFVRDHYRRAGELIQAALLDTPGPIPAYARLWAAWGRQLRKAALIHPERTFLYASVPKAANSTIKRLLWRRLGVEVSGPAAQRTLHLSSGPYLTLPDLGFDERRRVLNGTDVFRFTFVRNPYARLRSAYLQKLLQPDAFDRPEHYLSALGWRSPTPPSFEAFVRLVVRQSDARMNIHWKPQHRCVALDRISYDFVGRVERFEADIGVLLARIGGPASGYDPSISINRRGPGKEDRACYSEELAELVFRRYRRDFEAFGYSADSWSAAA